MVDARGYGLYCWRIFDSEAFDVPELLFFLAMLESGTSSVRCASKASWICKVCARFAREVNKDPVFLPSSVLGQAKSVRVCGGGGRCHLASLTDAVFG